MEFTIYSLGNVDFLAQILNSVAMICGTGNYTRLISVGFLIGLIFICFQSVFQGAQRINLQQTLVCFIVYLCMFGPSCTVLIEDVYKGQVRNVDNVPLGVGVSGMAISNIGYGLTKMMEQAFSDVDRTTEHGFGESLRILNELRVLNTDKDQMWMVIDRDLGSWGQGQSNSQQAMRNYLSECLFVDVALGRIQSPSVLASTPWTDAEVWQSRSDAHAVYLPVTGTNQTTGIVSCSRAYDLLDRTVMRRLGANVFQDWLDQRLGGVQSPDATQPATQSALTSMGLAQDKVQDFMQSLAINTIYDDAVADFYLTYHDQVSAAAVRQAQIQRNTQWASEGTMFLAAARALMAFFEGFIYAITPIMGFLIVTGAFGLGLVGKFFLLIVWVQLWLPILSITNLYINIGARSAVSAALGAEPSMYTINEMWAQVATWVSTGGMMAAATPMIALFLITGSTYAFTTLTNRLGGQDHFNERATSPDAVTTGAVLARAASYNANRTQGVVQTGAESEMKKLSLGKAFQANESESSSLVQGYNTALNAAIKSAAAQGQGINGLNSLSKDVRDSVQSTYTQASNAQRGTSVVEGQSAGQDASSAESMRTTTDARMGVNRSTSDNRIYDNSPSKDTQALDAGSANGKKGTIPKVRDLVGDGVSASGGIGLSYGTEHKQAESSGTNFAKNERGDRSRSVGNTLADSKTIDFTQLSSDALSKFAMANQGSEVGNIASKMASAMKTYQTAKQATTTFGGNTTVSMAAVTQGMSEQDARDLDNYFRFNHADQSAQIQKQAEKYSRLFGFDAARGKMAAQIDFLTESSNRQDLAFAGRILADNQMPIANRDVAGMQPGVSPVSEKDIQGQFQSTLSEAGKENRDVQNEIQQKGNELKEVDEKGARQDVSDKNVEGLRKVDSAGRSMEGSVRAEAQRQAWRDLNDASQFDWRDKFAHAIMKDGAGNVVSRLFSDTGSSPTQKDNYLLGGEQSQTITGLTAAQEKAVSYMAQSYWNYGNVDMSEVRAELKQARWGDQKLTPEQEKELDQTTAAAKEHLSAVAYIGSQAAAVPLTKFNTAYNLKPAHNQ